MENLKSRKGAAGIRQLMMFVLSLAVLGAFITAGVIFQPLNTTNLTAAGAPTFLITTGTLSVGALILLWLWKRI